MKLNIFKKKNFKEGNPVKKSNYWIENFKTFSSLIASVITYLCRHSPKSSVVVLLPSVFLTAFTANIGVPVKPKS